MILHLGYYKINIYSGPKKIQLNSTAVARIFLSLRQYSDLKFLADCSLITKQHSFTKWYDWRTLKLVIPSCFYPCLSLGIPYTSLSVSDSA